MTPEQLDWLARPTLLPPALRAVEGTRFWTFVEEYRVSLPPPFFPMTLVIPVGWSYDRSSIPSVIPTWFISRDSLGTLAPAPHDAGFEVKGRFPAVPASRCPYVVNDRGRVVPLVATRQTVDGWFLLYLLRQRIKPWKAYTAFNAVRVYWASAELVGLSKRW